MEFKGEMKELQSEWSNLSPVANRSESRQIRYARKRHLTAFTENLTLQRDNIALGAYTNDVRRRYSHRFATRPIRCEDCLPPTAISEIYRLCATATEIEQTMRGIVTDLRPETLHMGLFASTWMDYVNFLVRLPDSFGVTPTNEEAYTQLVEDISELEQTVAQGTQTLETNFKQFVKQASLLLQKISAEARAINASSRDFRRVAQAVRAYDDFTRSVSLEVWYVSDMIQQSDTELAALLRRANRDLHQAISQIETNMHSLAEAFLHQQHCSEDAFNTWRTMDGLEGFREYENILTQVEDILIPELNERIERSPLTARIDRTADIAQAAYEQIVGNFEAFPTYQPLPDPSKEFPYIPEGTSDQKYGEPIILEILTRSAVAHFAATGKKLGMGAMSYQHGGKLHPHSLHSRGIDADVYVFEAGFYPNNEKTIAIAAVRRFLEAGALNIFYADPLVVKEANDWAAENNLKGRLFLEASHVGHFHLRGPE